MTLEEFKKTLQVNTAIELWCAYEKRPTYDYIFLGLTARGMKFKIASHNWESEVRDLDWTEFREKKIEPMLIWYSPLGQALRE